MQLITRFWLLACVCGKIAAANMLSSNLVVHESVTARRGYVNVGPAAADTALNLRLGLVSADFATLEKRLYEVSTPSSSKYGQHLSTEEVKSYMAPKVESVTAVKQWLAAHNLTALPLGYGDWFGLETTVAKASVLFAANFSVFEHAGTGAKQVRTLEYSIPASLKGHLEVAHPLTSFFDSRTPRSMTYTPAVKNEVEGVSLDVNSPCPQYSETTPTCLQALYGLPSGKPNATGNVNSLTVTGYSEQYAQQSDLKMFLQTYRPDMSSNTSFALQEIDGGQNLQGSNYASYEANMDIQYTVGLLNGIPVSFLSSAAPWTFSNGSTGQDAILDSINFIANQTKKPTVVSTSYAQPEEIGSLAASVKICNAFAALGAQGVSLLYGSGDGGVGGMGDSTCTTFKATFPSGCPYITSVGATQDYAPEQSWPFSAGGFSNYHATPPYQLSAVKSYIAGLNGTYKGLYNASGRGFPDVSAQGLALAIVDAGYETANGGTSASTPIFASSIALLNDQLLHAGKSPLGFLNPWLYSTAANALNDITTGSGNAACGTSGFSPTAGWDPITGLGSPNFAKLRKAAGVS